EELAARWKQLPTVPEDELPELSNKPKEFRGLIEDDQLQGHTYVAFPFVENPGSFGFDYKGRLFVAEANRFWLGVPDLRGKNEMIRDDFKLVTVEDRAKIYEKFGAGFPEGWFTGVPDRIVRLEDRDGNGAADHRTLFSDHFKDPLDGIGFSLLADDGNVYFTCIPNVWKMTDEDDDGVADSHESIADGFGVRVSFIGHDLHGITRGPDGRLYFSVGDRSYSITDKHGKVHHGEGRGAIFRCEDDGTGLEIFADGLRNPQELAFDNYGNLFTFDNTGDIGDLARMVYALEGTDSGWNMSHQSAHQYANILDWGDFRPEKSMWVKERMFDTYNEEQPQWVYPPASHVARGPSGVTYLTGKTLPRHLQDKFLLTNYRGASVNCTILSVGVEPKGAGYHAVSEDVVITGSGASDVELGYDGKIYVCDYGGGWSVNTNGSIQVVESKDESLRELGKKIGLLFKEGFDHRPEEELAALLGNDDKRVRQAAQFALVKKGDSGLATLTKVARDDSQYYARLHAVWGIGQAARTHGADVIDTLLNLSEDPEDEVRANVCRVLGDIGNKEAETRLRRILEFDSSARVRSLAAIALSNCFSDADWAANAFIKAIEVNGDSDSPDIVLRHALITGLDRTASEKVLADQASSESSEVRLSAVVVLRRHESPVVTEFLKDRNSLVLREAVRAVYDTAVADTASADALANFSGAASLPESLQRRVVAANYRRGYPDHARNLLKIAANEKLEGSVRKAALIGLSLWENTVETDPVNGEYRPVVHPQEGAP
ncbi:MAG: PVC-type heme-binding CxxCH protein, partial [Verrucomicrobiota bacterium]